MSLVRNLGGIGSPKPIQVYHAIPPVSDAQIKLTIETDSETINCEDLIMSGSYTDGVTTTIGSFDFKIIDPLKAIYNQISVFDEIVIYADYGTPTNARFRGKIERRGYVDSYLTISGRSIGLIFSEKNIIYNSNGGKSKSTILTEIIENNFPDVDTSNIETNAETANVNYFEIPFSQIIEELCGSTHDFYLKHNYEAHYFEKGSQENNTEAIIEDINHVETNDNSDDSEDVYSKVRVYGSEIEGIPLISTSTEDTTYTKGIAKEYKIDNKSIITQDQATTFVNAEAEKRKNVPRLGEVSSLFLPTLFPGEKLFIALPREEISPNHYEIISYKHEFDLGNDIWAKTTINIKKQKQNISTIMKGRLNFESISTDNQNPNNMDFSLIYNFDTAAGTFSNTQRVRIDDESGSKYLLKTDGGNNGSWTSPIVELGSNVSTIEFRISGENLASNLATKTYIRYSLDGGNTFYLYDPSSTISVPTGRDLQIQVVLNSSDTEVNAIAALYKLQ